ncbi:J domain-containing protein [Hymenobacter qilianensis]|uniref:J domain-containing protein n=1 Tax=Hymenobacter qilianensis TaxID=1385715 RepID=A0A7H0GYN6_9BACT|nr:J domain-containing protein [Hymenobacter qilianensis]
MSQNHYQVLGVGATASVRDIKAAYKRLAIQYHPDKHGGSTRYEEHFKAVNAAYRVLSDAGRRAVYDHQLRRAAQAQEAQRQQQAYRQQGQRVYGVPMPPRRPRCARAPGRVGGAPLPYYPEAPEVHAPRLSANSRVHRSICAVYIFGESDHGSRNGCGKL